MGGITRQCTRAAVLAAAVLIAGITAVPAGAQQTARQPATERERELERLQARVDSLARVVEALRGAAGDTLTTDTVPADTGAAGLEAIRAAAAAAAGGETAGGAGKSGAAGDSTTSPREFTGRQRSQQALNPEVTVTGDVFGFVDFDHPGEETFVPRAVEFSFQSALDPYSLAKVFLGYHAAGGEIVPFGAAHDDEHDDDHEEGDDGHEEGEHEEDGEDGHGHGGGIAVEEAYLQWHGLPGGFNLQLGRFRQNFTPLNRWHPHALPGQSYPLPILAFFGEEGLAQTGVGVHWLAPWTGAGTWEVWTEVTASGNEALFGDARSLSVMGRVNGFWDLSPATYFELGTSAIVGPGQDGENFETAVIGADFTLSWRPPARSRYREATLRGGLMYGELHPVPLPGPVGRVGAWGGWAAGEYRLDRRWIVGGRAEYTENPLHPEESTWLVAPTLTWWQSEWVRLRAELDWLNRPDDTMTLLVLQATFAMGPHKHETY